MSIEKAIEQWMASQRSAWQGVFERMLSESANHLRTELAQQPQPAPGATSETLRAALQSIYEASAQADVLNALLDAASQFSGRCALFVLRGTSLSAYSSRNLGAHDSMGGLSFDAGHGRLANAVMHNTPVSGGAGDLAPELIARAGSADSAWAVPLAVRDRTVAVLYADTGSDGKLDGAALQILTRSAGLWLEVTAGRRAANVPIHAAPSVAVPDPQDAPDAVVAAQPSAQPPAPAVSSSNHPAVVPAAEQAPSPTPAAPVAPPATAVAVSTAVKEAVAAPPVAAEDELQRKARRFAKLLVDEIKLYNPAKVSDGKQHRDLYMRLREDIDKSRETFRLRYGSTPAWAGGYFEEELVRNLADGDRDAMGSAFHYPHS